jgi:hypothetical protein
MPIFLSRRDFTLPDSVMADLRTISANDGTFDVHTRINDPSLSQITFQTQASTDVSRQLDRLFRISATIVITGLSSDSEDPTHPPNAISGNGETFVADGIINVAYDVGQCHGNGIWAVGQSGNPIPTPNPVILYHELAHALRFANGQHSDDEATEERAAEIEENVMRTKLGVPLRNVDNHFGGCGILTGGGGGGAAKPIPIVSCVGVPRTVHVENHIQITWQAGAEYNFYLVRFGVAGGAVRQVEIDAGGRDGSFQILPAAAGTTYSVQVDGCFSHILDSDCSGFSRPVLVAAAANLHSVLQFCRLSGLDPTHGLHHLLAASPLSPVRLRQVLGV